MIAKVTRGRGFGGLQAYLLTGPNGRDGERVEWVAGRNLARTEPELAATIMRATAAESARIERPVYHLTISLAPEERLDREAMLRVVDRTLRDVGLSEHQALVVAHGDTGHQHVHVMLNRVHPESGRAWRAGHDYARIERSLRRQERELGLREVPGRHYSEPGRDRHRSVEISSGERRFAQRTGERSFGEHVRAVARGDLENARSWAELHKSLTSYGLHLEKRGRGVVLTDGRHRVKASYVDRGSSLSRLEKRLGTWRAPTRVPAQRTRRWDDIQTLRSATSRLARNRADAERLRGERLERWDERRLGTDRQRLELRTDRASRELDRRLQSTFRQPEIARRAIERHARSHGTGATAQLLAQEPGRFGRLRGRGGPLPSPERKEALSAGRDASTALRELETGRRAVARLPALSVAHLRVAKRADRPQVTNAGKEPSAELARLAARLAEQVGWRLAAQVLPAAHYQILKLSLSIPRKIVEASIGRERSLSR